MAYGECNCGAISFEITTEISDIYICHCSICQRASGGNGVAVVVVSNNDFRWLSGEDMVKTWYKPGHDWLKSFCPTCGSPVPGKNDENTTFIPVGLITEGAEGLKVKHHIFVDSKAAWDEIGDAGEQHSEHF